VHGRRLRSRWVPVKSAPGLAIRCIDAAASASWQLSTTSPVPGCSQEEARPPRKGRFSNRVTRKPASERAQAAASPARPPPAIATVCWDGGEGMLNSSQGSEPNARIIAFARTANATRGPPPRSFSAKSRRLRMTKALEHSFVHVRRFRKPFARMRSFSEVLRETLVVKTSYCFSAILSSTRR